MTLLKNAHSDCCVGNRQKQSDLPEALAARPQVAVAPISEGELT